MSTPAEIVLLLWLCLFCTPIEAIKIGISHNEYQNQTSTTTTTTITTSAMTTDVSGTSTLNPESTSSPLPEVVSTPTQTFPPRKLPKKPPTTAVTKAAAPTTPTLPTNATATNQTKINSRQVVGYNYCECDLHADMCEINCCCDRDCPPEALLVFDCLQSVMAPQLQSRLEDFQYTHGLPTCQLDDGWLCVFRTNTKSFKPQVS